ncbi:MAG TPA: OmpA family protein [Candidatus Krumholzibacteria bacterium]|nr:OmpA family protein [Candidatus Krumholzibacteria bacterium]
MKKLASCLLVVAIAASQLSCSSMSNTQKGAIGGAAAGGAIGGIIGHQSGNTAVGAIIGAAVGGAAGAWIGSYMDKQAAEIQRDLEGAKVERIGEGIKITFDSGLLFDVNRAVLKPASQQNLTELAVILNKYPDTNILLEGHTDSDGSEEHNLNLSELRSKSVANFLATQQVMETRFTTMGYGESQPIADNSTASGKAKNRRVEVAIYANDKLKKQAEKKVAEGG